MKSELEKYEGVIVPMLSPFTSDYKIDEAAVEKIIDLFSENQVLPFVLGTTGEVASLSPEQKLKLVKTAAEKVQGRFPLLAGIGNNSIFVSIEEGKKYADLGVDALVALAPNYYPIEEKHARNWFEKLADNSPLPMFLYNIPATTHHSVSLDLIEDLSHHPNVIGIKDSEQNQDRLDESLKRWAKRDDFLFLVGWAAMSAYGLKRGANGIVPSVANLVPDLYHQLYEAAKAGDFESAEKYQQLTNLVSSYSQSGRNVTGAIPALKALMSVKGLCGPQVLPPMLRMEQEEENSYIEEMTEKIMNLSIEI